MRQPHTALPLRNATARLHADRFQYTKCEAELFPLCHQPHAIPPARREPHTALPLRNATA